MTTIDSLVMTPQTSVPIFPIAQVQHDMSPTGWGGDCSVWLLTAADNEGSRITGLDSTGLAIGTTRWLHNLSRRVDAGVLVLCSADVGSVSANRIVTPNRRNYLVPSGGCVAVQLLDAMNPDTQQVERRWHVLDSHGRGLHLVTHSLGLYPSLLLAPISGVVDGWQPTVVGAGGEQYPSGMGIAGVSLRAEDGTKWTLQTSDASGATLRGIAWTTPNSMDPAHQGRVHEIYNAGPGPIVFEHLSAAVSVDGMRLPGARSYVMPRYARWSIHAEQMGGWSVSPSGEQPHVVAQSVTLDRVSNPVPSDITAVTLSGTVAAWNPTGAALNGSGNGQPLYGGARVVVPTGTATIESMVGPGAGRWRNGQFFIRNFGPGPLTVKHGVGANGNRFRLPGGADITIGQWETRTFVYDMTGQWMVV